MDTNSDEEAVLVDIGLRKRRGHRVYCVHPYIETNVQCRLYVVAAAFLKNFRMWKELLQLVWVVVFGVFFLIVKLQYKYAGVYDRWWKIADYSQVRLQNKCSLKKYILITNASNTYWTSIVKIFSVTIVT